MNKNLRKIILKISDWNEDGETQWWEPLLSLVFLVFFWLGFVGAVLFAMWIIR